MTGTKSPKTDRQLKGKKRVHNEVVEVASVTIDDEVPNDLSVQARGAAKLRVSTVSEVKVDGDAEEDKDEPPGGEMKAWDATTLGRRAPGRRFASPESLAKKTDAKLANKKEPMAPKFDVATAIPS